MSHMSLAVKYSGVIFRSFLTIGIVIICLTRMNNFADHIHRNPQKVFLKRIVDTLQPIKHELEKIHCKELGVYLMSSDIGVLYGIQTALAPIRTVHSVEFPLVLVQYSDKQLLQQWLTDNHRQVLARIDENLALTFIPLKK